MHFPFDSNLDTSKTQRGSLETGKMHGALVFGVSQGYTLFCYGGLEEEGTDLGCIVREGRVGRKESQQRLGDH